MARAVVIFKPKKNSEVTIRQMMARMDRYRTRHPNREVFFDGDEFAVCYIKS